LAVNTDGFSGADMNILVRDACYEPLRRCQNAKKFKKVGNGWFPCKPSDSQGTELNFMDLEGKNLQLPNVNIVMILN
jgi:vacuolar protein-sorting-associated protein 4